MRSDNCFVLIRGLLREARHWGDFTGILQQQFPDIPILTPDISGNGRLHHQTSPNTIAAMTDALRQQIRLDHPLNLIGISMGGMIAIDWMHRYPDEIQSAVLINTSARPLSPFYQRLRWQTYPTVIKMLFHSKRDQEQDILTLTSNRQGNNNDLLQTWQQWRQQYPVSSTSAGHQLQAAIRFTLPNKPPHPILIVTSTADKLVDYRCSLQLHKLWQKDYRQHGTAGHDLSLDEPQWLASVIRLWQQTR